MKRHLLSSLRNISTNILLIMTMLACFSAVVSASVEELRITEVNPVTGQVEVTNIGTVSFTATSDLPFCHRSNYFSSIPSGTLFKPGESRVFIVTGLDPNDSDIWLYSDNNFFSFTSILTGLKYGSLPNVGRMSVAVTAGIWPSTTAFVPVPITGQSLQLNTLDASKTENWVSSTPSFGSFSGTGSGIPVPDVKANGSDGSVTPTGNLSVTVALDPGSSSEDMDDNADWWAAANVSGTSTIDGWYYFKLSTFEFVPVGASHTDLLVTYQGSLFNLTTFGILDISISVLPPGTYTFYFAVDTNMNGSLDIDELFFDSVVVNITP